MTEDTHRQISLSRIANGKYVVTNEHGGQITIGAGDGTDFTPVELMLAAIGGCTAIDVDILTSRRARAGIRPAPCCRTRSRSRMTASARSAGR